jgi:DnaK suppressor protein
MTEAQKNEIRGYLQTALRELEASENQDSDMVEACADENEYASRLSEKSLQVALRERGARRIAQLREALARVDLDDFGICDECGGDIGLARLKAQPAATLCIQCASEAERHVA